ncbi:hypothetical protein BpHYR1_044010 [Brachionus plicatilis]|uniref:Uncharacterized protein n=1 Tax=Brachionus plicatilis TaxID=10195 RepID=A0A3M7PV02_BRAPC|nr:hypothetical protein BpHYR1_044010 [Brachionus plicatilis]
MRFMLRDSFIRGKVKWIRPSTNYQIFRIRQSQMYRSIEFLEKIIGLIFGGLLMWYNLDPIQTFIASHISKNCQSSQAANSQKTFYRLKFPSYGTNSPMMPLRHLIQK